MLCPLHRPESPGCSRQLQRGQRQQRQQQHGNAGTAKRRFRAFLAARRAACRRTQRIHTGGPPGPSIVHVDRGHDGGGNRHLPNRPHGKENASCCTLRPPFCPFTRGTFTPCIMHRVSLWIVGWQHVGFHCGADMNAATPPGVRVCSALCVARSRNTRRKGLAEVAGSVATCWPPKMPA